MAVLQTHYMKTKQIQIKSNLLVPYRLKLYVHNEEDADICVYCCMAGTRIYNVILGKLVVE